MPPFYIFHNVNSVPPITLNVNISITLATPMLEPESNPGNPIMNIKGNPYNPAVIKVTIHLVL